MLLPACPPGAVRSRTMVRSPSDAPYTAAASPAGPAPTTTRSYTAASIGRRTPMASASWRFEGLRRRSRRPQATTGVSFSLRPNCWRSWLTCGSASRSSQVNGARFLARKSRIRKVSCEYREPITRSPVKLPDSRISCLRARYACRTRSLSSGQRLSSSCSALLATASTSQSVRATAVTSDGLPVRFGTSPVKLPVR
jgi:hypothetical protein